MENEKRKMVIEGADKVSVIPHGDILYCQADGNYSKVFTNESEYIYCIRIGILERELNDPNFIRISQSLLINKNYLKHIHKKEKKIELIGGILLSCSMNIKTLVSLLKPKNKEEEVKSMGNIQGGDF